MNNHTENLNIELNHNVYPQQMVFTLKGGHMSVGTQPRSDYKIHEDCEVGMGNNPEDSSTKGISENNVNNILCAISPITENGKQLKNDDPGSDIHYVAILSGN